MAPKIAGSDMRNDSSNARSARTLSHSSVAIVIALRLRPGRTALPCARPTRTAPRAVGVSRSPFGAHQVDATATADPRRHTPMIAGELDHASTGLLSASPTTPVGIV